jgi:hypothetical protein
MPQPPTGISTDDATAARLQVFQPGHVLAEQEAMLVSQVIALYLAPVCSTYMEAFRGTLANGKMANGAEIAS